MSGRGGLTQAGGGGGRGGGVAFTLPLSTAVPRAQAVEAVSAGVFLGPGVSDTVGSLGVLVITAVWGVGQQWSSENDVC